jgi:hypothetical protein
MEKQNIKIRLAGKEFDQEKNLYLMVEALLNLNRIFEKSYLTISGKKRMNEKDREVFQLKAMGFKDGSLIIDLGMYVTALTQSSLFNSLTLNPKDIWTLIQESYTFLKTVLSANATGTPVSVAGDNNMIILITGNENSIEFRPEVIPYLKMAEPNFERISKMINYEKGVDEISFKNTNLVSKNEIKIRKEEKELFEKKTQLENEIVELKAKIFKLDAEHYIGKLRVLESNDEHIQNQAEYQFDFIQRPDQQFLSQIFLKEVKIYALKETYFNPTTLTKVIKKFSIINIEK